MSRNTRFLLNTRSIQIPEMRHFRCQILTKPTKLLIRLSFIFSKFIFTLINSANSSIRRCLSTSNTSTSLILILHCHIKVIKWNNVKITFHTSPSHGLRSRIQNIILPNNTKNTHKLDIVDSRRNLKRGRKIHDFNIKQIPIEIVETKL